MIETIFSETRRGMAEYIERAEAVKALEEFLESPYANGEDAFSCGVKDALKLIKDVMEDKVPNGLKIPPADVVQAVRCKDCKHNPKESWFGCPMSHLSEKQRPETAWCWKGERKDDE